MFDGNYRSRRQVNLSGKRRPKTQNRDAILEETRRKRAERQLAAAKTAASVHVQRVYRGYKCRKRLCRDLEEALLANNDLSLDQRTTMLNIRLRLDSKEDSAASLCEKYARFLSTAPTSRVNYILQTTLRLVRSKNLSLDTSLIIFKYCLMTTTTIAASDGFFFHRLGGSKGYRELLRTIQTLDVSSSLFQDLWKITFAATPDTWAGRAALGALVLSQEGAFLDNKRTALLPHDWTLDAFAENYFVPFVSVVTSTANNNNNMTDDFVIVTRQLEDQNQGTMLANAMFLSDDASTKNQPCALVRFLQRVMEQHSDLALLASLLAHSATGSVDLLSSSKQSDAAMVVDDSDDEDEDKVHAPTATAHVSSRATRTGTRLLKQDLQTLTKIDRRYRNEVEQWKDSLSVHPPSPKLLDLARNISSVDQWLKLGHVLLSRNNDGSEEVLLAQEAYMSLLATLLQTATGLHARQSGSSPFLTKLAFDKEFVEKLWRYVLVQVTNAAPSPRTFTALSVFSDIFTQRLIALKDDQFLFEYTTMHGEPRVILVEHVILHLRDYLYELYWSKPIFAEDVRVAFGRTMSEEQRTEAIRGRLLLTGTKLWQSLYERWCRLVRQTPFCDESTWLFPTMTTLSSEHSVVGMNRSRNNVASNMDLDDSDSEDEDGDHPMSAADVESEALAEAFSDARMARILTCIPQALPFDRRVKLFHSLLVADKMKTQDEAAEMHQVMMAMMRGEEGEMSTRARVEIHRDRLYDDSMQQLSRLGPKLKKKVQVTFINQHGATEAGIDGGGVFKEFIDDLIKDAFIAEDSSHAKLFTITSLQTLAVNPELTADASMLEHYEFLGRVLGKAVYESILVEPQFCLPFLNQLLGKTNSLEDLKNFDPEFYRNLVKLLSLSPSDVDSLGLTFELSLGKGPSARSVELLPGGRSKPVTKQNVIQYIHLVAHQRLNVESAQQTRAFLRGFRDLIPASWVRLFSAYELQKLISGDDSIRGIDVQSLKNSMQYAGGYHPSQPIVQWFWEIVDEMTADEQRKFLKFMTSCSRQPLLGFGSLEPAPCIQQIRLGQVTEKSAPLPTSSTCMNLLKLPNYGDKELMRKKLKAAIESGAGFELT